MMGLGDDSNTVHLIDFGLTRFFIDPNTRQHIPEKKYRHLVGTCLFCSPNSHKGIELTRRDDLITLGYVILQFVRGNLPWQSVRTGDAKERYKLVGQMKIAWTNAKLCEGLPPQFKAYMDYVTGLSFDQPGNFQMMKKLITDCARQNNIDLFDNTFDWSLRLSQLDEQSPSDLANVNKN